VAACGQVVLQPRTMPKVGEVDARFVSYNVEAVEVTGGRFWKPYASKGESAVGKSNQNQPAGLDQSLYQYRAPIDLANPRLRKLASALSPAYVRVSGTWRNSTYFQDDDLPAMSTPPKGFNGVMTRAQWKGVVEFAHATSGEIVTSVATSAGTRDEKGLWTADQAKAFFDYSQKIGGRIAATEFMNEPSFAFNGGAAPDYNAKKYSDDVKVFKTFLRKQSSGTMFLGPGSVGEGIPLVPGSATMPKMIATEDMLKESGPVYDAFSYHFYGTISKRCTGLLGPNAQTSPDILLTPDWLNRNVVVEEFYAKLRDQYLPGKAMWLTETGEAGCGGDPWASQFVETFRYVDQLGTLAKKNVKVVMQNTLASSDYGFLDEDTLDPRPNFWAAVLWKRTMGERVLDAGVASTAGVRVFAHCMKGAQGGVALVVLNMDAHTEAAFHLPIMGRVYRLSAPDVFSRIVRLNGVDLKARVDGTLPNLGGEVVRAGTLRVAPLTIDFVTLPTARNSNCM